MFDSDAWKIRQEDASAKLSRSPGPTTPGSWISALGVALLVLILFCPGTALARSAYSSQEDPPADAPEPAAENGLEASAPAQVSPPSETGDPPTSPEPVVDPAGETEPVANEAAGIVLPPRLERLDRLLSDPSPGAVRLLMEELAAAGRAPELAGVLRGFAALTSCFEADACDIEAGVLGEVARLAEIRGRPRLAERLRALGQIDTSLGSPTSDNEEEDMLQYLAGAAIVENPEGAVRFENLGVLVSVLNSGAGDAELLRGVAAYLESVADGNAGLASAGESGDLTGAATEAASREPVASDPRAVRIRALASLDDLVLSESGGGDIVRGVADFRTTALVGSAAIGSGMSSDTAALRLYELADFDGLLHTEASESEVLDNVSSLLPQDHRAAPSLEGLAELSRIVEGKTAASSAQTIALLEGLANLLPESALGGAERIRSLAVVSSAVDGPPAGAGRGALTALAEMFPVEAAPARGRLLALADLDAALESQDPASPVAILRQTSELAARDNPTTASTLSALARAAESTADPSAEAVPVALDSMAFLFDPGNPSAGATVRSLGIIGGVVHSSSDKAVARALERAEKGLRKESPEASAAFGQLAQVSQDRIAQAKADGAAKKGEGGGLLRSLLLTGAAVVVGQENAAAGDALARVASGESVKRAALQGAADVAGQGDLDEHIGETGAALVGGLSESMLTVDQAPGEPNPGTSPAPGGPPPAHPVGGLAPDSIRFTNAAHEWIDRSDTGWIFRWRVTITNTTSEDLRIAIVCNLDQGPGSEVVLASDAVNVLLEAGQILDIPYRTFTVAPAVAEQATSVGLYARLASAP